jgi:ubiquinone/menaquinone biosynthesis C-methylase UbiE
MPEHGFSRRVVTAAYGAVADDYMGCFGDDLARLDLDRRIVRAVAARAHGTGLILDIGCGPAQLAEYLLAQGADAIGVDFTTEMLEVARTRLPSLMALRADVRDLPLRAAAAAGAVCFYVLQHLERDEVPTALAELRRCVRRSGVVALAVHEGVGDFQVGDVTATLYGAEELARHLAAARFEVESIEHRDPLPHERQGPRAYLTAVAS